MALLSTLVKTIAEVEGLEETQVAWVARHLREAGLLSQAGRGRGAAHMEVRDAANLLIAVNGSTTPKQCADAVLNFRSLSAVKSTVHIDGLPLRDEADMDQLEVALSKGQDFGSALEAVITSLVEVPGSEPRLSKELDIIVSFIRPIESAEIFIGDLSNPDDPEGYFGASFERTTETTRSHYPDKTDETRISTRTLARVSEVISTK